MYLKYILVWSEYVHAMGLWNENSITKNWQVNYVKCAFLYGAVGYLTATVPLYWSFCLAIKGLSSAERPQSWIENYVSIDRVVWVCQKCEWFRMKKVTSWDWPNHNFCKPKINVSMVAKTSRGPYTLIVFSIAPF